MVRELVFGAMLHTYCTRIAAVQPRESEDLYSVVIGWVCEKIHLLRTRSGANPGFQKSRKPAQSSMQFTYVPAP